MADAQLLMRAALRPWGHGAAGMPVLTRSTPLGARALPLPLVRGVRGAASAQPGRVPRLSSGVPTPSVLLRPRTIATQATGTGTQSGGQPTPQQSPEEPPEGDEPSKTASTMQRLRFMMKRYGWWAVGIYLVVGTVDLSIAMVIVHSLGGEYVKELEHRARDWLGLDKKAPETTETAEKEARSAAKEAYESTKPHDAAPDEREESLYGQLVAEFVIAYGIHKTLFLLPRAAITLAITPKCVRWLVRRGWARRKGEAVVVPERPRRS